MMTQVKIKYSFQYIVINKLYKNNYSFISHRFCDVTYFISTCCKYDMWTCWLRSQNC